MVFLGKPCSHLGGAALTIRLAIVKAKKKLEPKLEACGLSWNDVKPILETMDSPEKIREASKNPDLFLQQLIKGSTSLTKKIAMIKLRPLLEPKIKKTGLSWDDVEPVLLQVMSNFPLVVLTFLLFFG